VPIWMMTISTGQRDAHSIASSCDLTSMRQKPAVPSGHTPAGSVSISPRRAASMCSGRMGVVRWNQHSAS
jgi:hypothetical protein